MAAKGMATKGMAATTKPSALALIVHHIDQADVFHAQADELDLPLLLLTPAGGAGYTGPAFYREIAQAMAEQWPRVECRWIVDCGDDPALALEALEFGFTEIFLSGNKTARDRVRDVARQTGASLWRRRPAARDLSLSGDPAAACRDLLLLQR